MSADFNPTPTPKTSLTPFRYWVQRVLPVVYDDSLSYQELLGKVVDYLNNVITDVNAVITDVDNLHAAYEQLEQYVNDYFDNLDLQEQIDNKLDEMAADGSLTALISPFIPNLVTDWLTANVDPVGSAVIVDSSLSIAGAAADAKTVGDKGYLIRGLINSSETLLSNVTALGFYGLIAANLNTLTDLPADMNKNDGNCLVKNQALNASTITQEIIQYTNTANPKHWIRSITPVITAWKLISGIDKTFTKENFGADAELTGNRLNFLDENVFTITPFNFSSIGTADYPLGWRTGYYNDAGITTSSTHYIRTTSRMHFNYPIKMIELKSDDPDKGFQISEYETADASTFVQNIGNYEPVVRFVPVTGYRYSFSYGRYDSVHNEDIDAEFLSGIHMNIFTITDLGKLVIKYESGSFNNGEADARLFIFVPTNNGYIKYTLYHFYNMSINCNTWQIYHAYYVSGLNDSDQVDLTVTGEWECALHLEGRDNFSGGHVHGNEILVNINFFIDGRLVDITQYTALTFIDNLRIEECTNLYDPADNSTVIAAHGREYLFTGETQLTLSQSIEWKVAESLTNCFLSMFTPKKDLTDRAYVNTEFVPIVLTDTDFTIVKHDATKIFIWDSENKLTAAVEVLEYPTGLSGGDLLSISDNGGLSYNKVYFKVCGSGTSQIGQIWKTKTVYSLDYAVN